MSAMRIAIPALNLPSCAARNDAMHIVGHAAIGFLIVCMLLAATKALSVGESPASMLTVVADVAPVQVVVPDTTQSPRQPTSGPVLEQQNQAGSALERLQDHAEEEEDLLKILD
jgi:hypothetical protein